jgi:hypothetical protein
MQVVTTILTPEFARGQLTFYVSGSDKPIFHFQSDPHVLNS